MLPTEKERALCVCWPCLNVRMLYHTLYSKRKKDGHNLKNLKELKNYGSPLPPSPHHVCHLLPPAGFFQLGIPPLPENLPKDLPI